MPGPLVLLIPILIQIIQKLVVQFLKKYAIKKIGKRMFCHLLRDFLLKSIKKLPRNQYTERFCRWLEKAKDDEIENLISPEKAVWDAVTDIMRGKTTKLDVRRTTSDTLLKDNRLNDTSDTGLLGKEDGFIRENIEPYDPPISTKIDRWGKEGGYGQSNIGNIFRF